MWNAREMEEAAARGSTVPPQYLRIGDSHVTLTDPTSCKAPPPPGCTFLFALNNAGSYVFGIAYLWTV
jgi:CCR4-NOT transcriptional complex subunit CAF120